MPVQEIIFSQRNFFPWEFFFCPRIFSLRLFFPGLIFFSRSFFLPLCKLFLKNNRVFKTFFSYNHLYILDTHKQKDMKLTDKQRLLFSDLVIKNLEFSLEKDPMRKFQLSVEVRKLKIRLRRSMGVEAYEKFITQGKQAYGIAQRS